jgi:integrase
MARNRAGVYPYERNGKTLYRTVFRDSAGRQRQKRGFTSPTATAKYRAEMMVRADRGELRSTRQKFDDWFDEWLRGHHAVSPGTRADYRRHGEKRLKPFFGQSRLSAITVQLVKDFVADQVEQVEAGDLAPKTVNNALTCLSTCVKEAVSLGKIPSNPCDHVAHLPERHIERDWLRRHEIPLYVDACPEVYRPLAEVLIATGMRISEALALRWDDIDFANRVIRVYRQRTATGGDGHTKSRRFRSVAVGNRLLGGLRDLQARQAEIRVTDATRAHVFVMPVRRRKTDRGRWSGHGAWEPMDRNTVSRDWHKAALEDAGLRDMPLHALRHTAAAAWLLSDQPLMFVQRQLGHSSITITERYYGHLEQAFQQTAANETEAAIWGLTPAAA